MNHKKPDTNLSEHDKDQVQRPYKHYRSKLLKVYADIRVGATHREKFAYRTGKEILFTFDDYGTKKQVVDLLKALDTCNAKAMFFVQGSWSDKNADLVKRIVNAGHIVGNHTYNHLDLTSLDEQTLHAEITRGVQSEWLRSPMGKYNKSVRKAIHAQNMKIVYWTVDSDDWQGVSGDYMKHKILRQIHPGAVILFHMHCNKTIQALPAIAQAIRAKGYEFEPIIK